MGDPAGIGPELCLRLLEDRALGAAARLVIFGDAALLRRVATQTGQRPPAQVVPLDQWVRSGDHRAGLVQVPGPDLASLVPGRDSAEGGRAAYNAVEAAIQAALAGQVEALVTAPLSKASLHKAGLPFPGHTEILATLTRSPATCMMLCSEAITTSLVTTHIPLSSVPTALSAGAILSALRLTASAMRHLRQASPRLIVCALNPHAGEQGLFGDEEARLILPAIEAARREGLEVEGPLPPDTAFLPSRLGRTTAHLCMYHDQGLIPFKMLAFESGVNITLGLPIIRTSPDHGTAFDLAWTGRANPASMRQAVLYALQLATRKPS